MTTNDLPIEIAGVRYSVCEAAEVPEMVRVLAATFARHDPPAVAAGLTPEDFEAFLTIVSATAGADGLTIVAHDVASGSLAGALLTEDAAAPAQVDLEAIAPGFEPIFDIFGQLEDPSDGTGPIEQGQTLHLFMLGVDGRFARRGIAQELVRACLANGAARGYRTAVTEATNLVSQHIFAKLGFTARARASYADYRRDGIAVFASIAGQGGPMAMTRALEVDA